jgi:hypothetical protein
MRILLLSPFILKNIFISLYIEKYMFDVFQERREGATFVVVK